MNVQDRQKLIDHISVICNYAESIIDELTIIKAELAGDEKTVAMLENL